MPNEKYNKFGYLLAVFIESTDMVNITIAGCFPVRTELNMIRISCPNNFV